MAAGKGYKSCTHLSQISHGGRLEMDRDPEDHSRGYDQLCKQFIAKYEGIVLLEEKKVSSSPIDWQDM